jgi:hypothetical protein
MALCSVAILVYFLRPENRDGFHWFRTLVAPILGAGSIAFAIYLMVSNRSTLLGTPNTGFTFITPLIALGIFLAGCVLGLIYQRWSKQRYEAVGKFVHEEA